MSTYAQLVRRDMKRVRQDKVRKVEAAIDSLNVQWSLRDTVKVSTAVIAIDKVVCQIVAIDAFINAFDPEGRLFPDTHEGGFERLEEAIDILSRNLVHSTLMRGDLPADAQPHCDGIKMATAGLLQNLLRNTDDFLDIMGEHPDWAAETIMDEIEINAGIRNAADDLLRSGVATVVIEVEDGDKFKPFDKNWLDQRLRHPFQQFTKGEFRTAMGKGDGLDVASDKATAAAKAASDTARHEASLTQGESLLRQATKPPQWTDPETWPRRDGRNDGVRSSGL